MDIFASYKVLLNSVKMNAVPLRSNYTLTVVTKLPHPLSLYIDYSDNRKVRVLRDTVARMILQNR